MSFLKCLPTVYVLGNEYEISITAKTKGLCSIKIGDETFYQENTGLLKSEENYAKIRVPQFVLNEAETYEICFRETLERKGYFPQFKEMESVKFAFKPF